jgi:hypothetical protein
MKRSLGFIFAALVLALSACAPSRAVQQMEQIDDHPAAPDPDVIDTAFPPAMHELSFESGVSKLNGLVYVANGPGPHPATCNARMGSKPHVVDARRRARTGTAADGGPLAAELQEWGRAVVVAP